MKKLITIMPMLFIIFLTGCVAIPPIVKEDSITPSTYNYTELNADKNTIFIRARDHFATIYGDSRSVIRVQEQKEGIILGKGAIDWILDISGIGNLQCTAEYNVRFLAKDNKARLQLELINGAPSYSKCSGWPLPTETAYKKIQTEFDAISIQLEKALKGLGSVESFKDF